MRAALTARARTIWAGRHTRRLAAANSTITVRQSSALCSQSVSGQKRVEAKPAISVRWVIARPARGPAICASVAKAVS